MTDKEYLENLKEKLQRLSTIITDLWDIFPEETQEELNILLESEDKWKLNIKSKLRTF